MTRTDYQQHGNYTTIKLTREKTTLGVIGIMGLIVADAPNTGSLRGGQKYQISSETPIFLLQNKAGCPPCQHKKLKRKSLHNFDVFGRKFFGHYAQWWNREQTSCVVLGTPSQQYFLTLCEFYGKCAAFSICIPRSCILRSFVSILPDNVFHFQSYEKI